MPAFDPTISVPAVEYRDIPDFPGYRAGDDGTVWSCLDHGRPGQPTKLVDTWKIMQGGKVHGRYRMVSLVKDGKKYGRPMHRLVLEAFVGIRPPGKQCRHLNGDSFDNRLLNICWGTPIENARDSQLHGTSYHGTRCHKAKIDEEKVVRIRELLKTGLQRKQIAAMLGVSRYIVGNIGRGVTWKQVED